VRAGLGFLSLAPNRIGFPLLAPVYRASTGKSGFQASFVRGKPARSETALAALCQQHFGFEPDAGTAMDAGCLPTNFASTGNTLRSLSPAEISYER